MHDIDRYSKQINIQKVAMNNKQGNVFIEDRQENQSFDEALDKKLVGDQDDNQDNSDAHNINDEQIDQLLDDEGQSKQEIVLRFKVNELQKICNSLTATNRKLIDKLTAMEEEKQSNKQEIFVDQYSQLNVQFTQVQTLINQYKQSLDLFQHNALTDMKNKEDKISKLRAENKQLREQNSQLHQEKEDMEKLNKQLETRNEGLILEIENLEKDKARLEDKINIKSQQHYQQYASRYDNHYGEDELPAEVQNQYQVLIERLVKELQYERNIKKKMSEEIKRMSHELMESERQIMDKNKKLYEIQMKLLRSSKTTADSSYSKFRSEDLRAFKGSRQDINQKINNKSQRAQPKTSFKNFVLLQLINGQLEEEISNIQRKIIGVKVIEFYQRKMQRQDFSNVMPENLLICNFSHKRPELLLIRKIGTSAYEDGQKTQQSLVWNLAFILDNLFGQVQGIQDFNQILQLTGQILEKQVQNNRDNVQEMKELLCV